MPIEKRNIILRLLVEGNGIRAVARLMRTNILTLLRQLAWAGEHCGQLLGSPQQGLALEHVECDEIWTFARTSLVASLRRNRPRDAALCSVVT